MGVAVAESQQKAISGTGAGVSAGSEGKISPPTVGSGARTRRTKGRTPTAEGGSARGLVAATCLAVSGSARVAPTATLKAPPSQTCTTKEIPPNLLRLKWA